MMLAVIQLNLSITVKGKLGCNDCSRDYGCISTTTTIGIVGSNGPTHTLVICL